MCPTSHSSLNSRRNNNANICFCINIKVVKLCPFKMKMQKDLKDVPERLFTCASHTAPCFRGLMGHSKSFIAQIFRTYVPPFVSSPEGCKLKKTQNTWLLCGRGDVAASRSVSGPVTRSEMWHTTARCLQLPGLHTSAARWNTSFMHARGL